MSNPIVIGRFGKVFGIQGWIKVNSFTTPRKSILDFRPWFIQKNNSCFWEKICFDASREHLESIIVKLPNCNSPEEARVYTNIEIGVWREQLPKLPPDEYYWTDLIGLKVVNLNGVDFGMVQELMATGSNDVLVVLGDRKYLIPYLSDVVLKVDLVNKTIYVDWEQDFL